jgi:flagellar hook-associated protein FlgK
MREGADMTNSTRGTADTQALEDRRDRALERLAQRAGVGVPEIRSPDGSRPLSSAEYLIGGLAMDTFLLEMVAALAAEVDGLKADIAMVRDEQVSTS